MHMPYDDNDAPSADELDARRQEAAPEAEEAPRTARDDEAEEAPGLVDPRREGTPDYATPSSPPY